MKRFSLYFAAIIMALSYMLPSCKKTTHPTYPTPGNYRLLGYTVTTTPTTIVHALPVPAITANYSFSYDGNNRVSQIIYTTNDSNLVKTGRGTQTSTFTYSGGTINKTISLTTLADVIERDTFTENGAGQITSGNFPFIVYNYSYYGLLLFNESVTARDTGTTLTANLSYTSNSGDFLNRTFDGTLQATFPDSGIKPVLVFPDTVWDTILSYPLTVTYSTVLTGGVITHNGVNPYTDQIGGYTGNEIVLNAVDPNGILTRTVTFPADAASAQSYIFYSDQNRTGDYLQLGSFTTYGVNVYQNANLVQNIKSPIYTTNVTYTIDADSKITGSVVTRTDQYGNVYTSVYNLQYQTF